MDLAAVETAIQAKWPGKTIHWGSWEPAVGLSGVEQREGRILVGNDAEGTCIVESVTVLCEARGGGASEKAYSRELTPQDRLLAFRLAVLAMIADYFPGTWLHANVTEWGEAPSCIVEAWTDDSPPIKQTRVLWFDEAAPSTHIAVRLMT